MTRWRENDGARAQLWIVIIIVLYSLGELPIRLKVIINNMTKSPDVYSMVASTFIFFLVNFILKLLFVYYIIFAFATE